MDKPKNGKPGPGPVPHFSVDDRGRADAIDLGDMIREAAETIEAMRNELFRANQAVAFWSTIASIMLKKYNHTDPETQLIVTPEMINDIEKCEMGYTNNNRGPKTKHYFFVKPMEIKEQPTGEEMRNAGKKQSTGGSGLVGFDGKPITNKPI